MQKIASIFIILSLSCSVFIDSSYAAIHNAGKYLSDNVISKKLSNGITVLLLNRGYSPTLALNISFRIGSVDESYKTIGMAHMLEHMLFKGTDKIGTIDYDKEKKILNEIEQVGEKLNNIRLSNPKDRNIPNLENKLKILQNKHRKFVQSSPYDRIYTAIGGVGFNASTSRDRTSYVIELPASQLEVWAQVESERLRNPVMREFYLEKGAVMEERLMRYESGGTSKLYEKFIATAFLAHPYRHPTIGWKSNIQFFSINQLRNFYKEYYRPSVMTITVVGRQDIKRSLKILESYFGKLQKRNEPERITIKEPEQHGERRFEIYFDANPYLIIGWHKPTVPSRDDYVADVIEGILTGGKASRLYKRIVLKKKIAVSVDAWNGSPGARYDNLLVITSAPKYPHKPKDVEKEILKEIDKLREDVTKEEIDKVINRIESSMIFRLDSNSGISYLLNY